jgi:hypothetical protein
MKLETLLKPIKYLDENVILRQYTKLGKKINIDKGKRKYNLGHALWLTYAGLCGFGEGDVKLFDKNFAIGYILFSGANDGFYNVHGSIFGDRESVSSDTIALDPIKQKHKKYNSFVRLPTFLFGFGLVAKFGIDAIKSIQTKTTIEPKSWYCLMEGIGQLSLASSMYLKETDTKLLDKVPLGKQALNYIKEKINSLNPVPVPVPAGKIS